MASAPSALPWWRTWTRWTQSSPNEAQAASQGLLSLVQGPPINSSNVAVGPGPENYLHTISNRPVPEESLVAGTRVHTTAGTGETPATLGGPPVVLMPGYGAGVGFYFKNLGPLSSAVRLYGVDWLGTGLSGRPKYHAKTREAAEAFFIDSLSMWRSKVGLEKERMVLVGHSLGGYLAAAYALKHPEHIEHLVLVCPAGVPKAPEDWQKAFLGGRSGLRTQMFKAAMWAWESGVTPHSVIRALGPWGPKACDRYVVNRFSQQGDGFAEQEMHWFQKYFYGIIAAQGSGEYALRHLLAPGAWAHEPLVSRLRDLKVPVTFIYGESDWMRPQHAVDLCKELKKERPPKVESDLHVEIIEDAGHFVFIDQPELFHHALLRACSKYFDKPFLASPTSKGEDSSMWRRPENEAQAQTSPSS